MLDKTGAIAKIKEIQDDEWNRGTPKCAKSFFYWNQDCFRWGMEYGAMLALMQAFDLTEEDFK